jgi:2',3'-cyclic-nucleotide 2'-phosphodiesterase (5'-nucleotidase family)
MTKIYDYENDLGNLITNLMNSAVPGNDFVIINAGGFRSTWTPGILQFQHFYNMFPFTNTINSFEMTGKELLDTLSIIQVGSNGFYPTYGLKQTVSLSRNGVKRFIDAKFYNGT